MQKLLVISDSRMQNFGKDRFGFNAVVNELEIISSSFDEIVWVGSDYSCFSRDESLKKIDEKYKIYALPIVGGKGLKWRLYTLLNLFKYLVTIIYELTDSTVVHVRGPNSVTLMTIFLIPFYKKQKWWFKYSTNWGANSSSLSFNYQKYLLKKPRENLIVTVNGVWPNQPKHFVSFENPCISHDDVIVNNCIKKSFQKNYRVVFIGRLEAAKGLDQFLEIIDQLPRERFDEWIFIGEGPMEVELRLTCKKFNLNAKFLGSVGQSKVYEVLRNTDFLMLPSKSEGFPKVVSEAWAFKVIPLVSPVGCLSQYVINGENGFIMDDLSSKSLLQAFLNLLNYSAYDLNQISEKGYSMAYRFTFDNYYHKLQKEVFN